MVSLGFVSFTFICGFDNGHHVWLKLGAMFLTSKMNEELWLHSLHEIELFKYLTAYI